MFIRWLKPKNQEKLKLQIATKELEGETVWENIPVFFEDESEKNGFYTKRQVLKRRAKSRKKVVENV